MYCLHVFDFGGRRCLIFQCVWICLTQPTAWVGSSFETKTWLTEFKKAVLTDRSMFNSWQLSVSVFFIWQNESDSLTPLLSIMFLLRKTLSLSSFSITLTSCLRGRGFNSHPHEDQRFPPFKNVTYDKNIYYLPLWKVQEPLQVCCRASRSHSRMRKCCQKPEN